MASHESFSGWFLALMRSLLGVGREGAVERSQKSGGGKVVDQRPGWLEYGYRLASVMAGVVMLPLRWLQAKLMRGDELIVIAGRRGFHS